MALLGVLALVAARLIDNTRAAPALAPRGLFTKVPVSQVALAGIVSSACISYPATQGRGDRTVFIDPGHGGIDPGVVGVTAGSRQVLEKDATLAVATRLTALLRADGFRVVMARTQDTSVIRLSAGDTPGGSISADAEHRDLAARAACANASGASALLSIHFDGFSDPSVGGTETFYDAARPFADASHRLAQAVQAALVANLAEPDRGVWTDDQLAAPTLTNSGSSYGHLIELGPAANGWVDNPSEMPGALVEPLFVTNRAEAQIVATSAGQLLIAQALESGLLKYFSVAG